MTTPPDFLCIFPVASVLTTMHYSLCASGFVDDVMFVRNGQAEATATGRRLLHVCPSLCGGGALSDTAIRPTVVRLSVPWRSCLYRDAACCLQLSHRRPTEMCGLQTRPRIDVDPPRFLDQLAVGGGISLRWVGRKDAQKIWWCSHVLFEIRDQTQAHTDKLVCGR